MISSSQEERHLTLSIIPPTQTMYYNNYKQKTNSRNSESSSIPISSLMSLEALT